MSLPGTDDAPLEIKCKVPTLETLAGKHVILHPVREEHISGLYKSTAGEGNESLYDFMSDGPFLDPDVFRKGFLEILDSPEVHMFCIEDLRTKQPAGIILFTSFVPRYGSLEIGLVLGPSIQRTVGATEAVYLMLAKAFDVEDYRRVEWKCNNRHDVSKRAAARLGFTLEGVFRQHQVVKGKNRDTAYFSMLDKEWPSRKAALEGWMDSANFDEDGRQRRNLLSFQEGSSS